MKLRNTTAAALAAGITLIGASTAQAAQAYPTHCHTWLGTTPAGAKMWVAECLVGGQRVSSAQQGVYFGSHAGAVWATEEYRRQYAVWAAR